MGKQSPAGPDFANAVVAGSFTATGQSGWASLTRDFNIAIYGTFVGTVILEKSYDGGNTAIPVSRDGSGTASSWTGPFTALCKEPEQGVLFRFNCTAFTSGTINYRLSQ